MKPSRWWGVRHVRWLFAFVRYCSWRNIDGIYALTVTDTEVYQLDAIWKGEA